MGGEGAEAFGKALEGVRAYCDWILPLPFERPERVVTDSLTHTQLSAGLRLMIGAPSLSLCASAPSPAPRHLFLAPLTMLRCAPSPLCSLRFFRSLCPSLGLVSRSLRASRSCASPILPCVSRSLCPTLCLVSRSLRASGFCASPRPLCVFSLATLRHDLTRPSLPRRTALAWLGHAPLRRPRVNHALTTCHAPCALCTMRSPRVMRSKRGLSLVARPLHVSSTCNTHIAPTGPTVRYPVPTRSVGPTGLPYIPGASTS